MLVFRSLVLGLLGACALLLATREPIVKLVKLYRPAPPSATLIDVAAGVPTKQLGSLVKLERDEHVTMVDDLPTRGDLDAGSILSQLDSRPAFVDLEVDGGLGGHRRVVLLLH
jgi:hypothetical protein